MSPFEQKVFSLVSQIPRGKITTYQLIAQKLGDPHLARAVGNVLPKNPHLIRVPCHRVVKSDGTLGQYKLGLAKKKELLQNEGIIIKQGKIIECEKRLYDFN